MTPRKVKVASSPSPLENEGWGDGNQLDQSKYCQLFSWSIFPSGVDCCRQGGAPSPEKMHRCAGLPVCTRGRQGNAGDHRSFFPPKLPDRAKCTPTSKSHTTLHGLAKNFVSLYGVNHTTSLTSEDVLAIFRDHGIIGNPIIILDTKKEMPSLEQVSKPDRKKPGS